MRAGRMDPLSKDEIELRQCTLGELCCVAAVSRPDICARLARIATRINALRGSDAYRKIEVVRAVEKWQCATVLKYASTSRPWKTPGGGGKAKVDLCNRGEGAHAGRMSLVGWSDAALGASRQNGNADWVTWLA